LAREALIDKPSAPFIDLQILRLIEETISISIKLQLTRVQRGYKERDPCPAHLHRLRASSCLTESPETALLDLRPPQLIDTRIHWEQLLKPRVAIALSRTTQTQSIWSMMIACDLNGEALAGEAQTTLQPAAHRLNPRRTDGGQIQGDQNPELIISAEDQDSPAGWVLLIHALSRTVRAISSQPEGLEISIPVGVIKAIQTGIYLDWVSMISRSIKALRASWITARLAPRLPNSRSQIKGSCACSSEAIMDGELKWAGNLAALIEAEFSRPTVQILETEMLLPHIQSSFWGLLAISVL